MTNWGLIVGLIVGIQYAFHGYQYVYLHYIRPFLYYKINIFDVSDEYVFYIKKKKCETKKDLKVFTLFKNKKGKGEVYSIPIKTDGKNVYSKRDNVGHVTYYYFRNNTNPISLVKDSDLQIYENSSMLYDLLESKIFDSSLMIDSKKIKIDYMLIGIVSIAIILIVIFKDDILKALGV